MNTSQMVDRRTPNINSGIFEDEAGINHRVRIKVRFDLYHAIDYSIKKMKQTGGL